MAEHDQQFETFQTWVDKASSWLARRGAEQAICLDAKGRLCSMGRDWMRARDESAFPVRWLWPEQVAAELAEIAALRARMTALERAANAARLGLYQKRGWARLHDALVMLDLAPPPGAGQDEETGR
jgi:hypothetical protein